MEDCPVCKKIAEGKILAEHDGLCIIPWGKDRVVVQVKHGADDLSFLYEPITVLLDLKNSVSLLASFNEVAGHGGFKIVQNKAVTNGQSRGRQ